MLDGEGAWKHNEKIDLVVNPDYDGARKAANGGLDIVFYATQDAAYADLRAATSTCSTPSPTARSATFEDDLGDRAVNQPAAIFQSFTIPDRLAALRWRGGQAASSGASRWRSTARRSPT